MNGRRGIAPLILELGAGWMWVVTIRPRPKVPHWGAGCVCPKAGVDVSKEKECLLFLAGFEPRTIDTKAGYAIWGPLLCNGRNLGILTICRKKTRHHSSEDSCTILCVKVTMWNWTFPNMAGNGQNSVGQTREDSRDSISKRIRSYGREVWVGWICSYVYCDRKQSGFWQLMALFGWDSAHTGRWRRAHWGENKESPSAFHSITQKESPQTPQ